MTGKPFFSAICLLYLFKEKTSKWLQSSFNCSIADGVAPFHDKNTTMIERNRIKLVTAFSGDFIEAKAIQDLLKDNQITATLENSYMAFIAPWLVTPGGSNPVNVVVKDSDLDRALKLIDELNPKEEI